MLNVAAVAKPSPRFRGRLGGRRLRPRM